MRRRGRREKENAVFVRDVAPGIHMIQNHHVNCYLLEDSSVETLQTLGVK